MEQTPETQVQFINYNSLLTDIQLSMREAKQGLKDIEIDLLKLSQDKNFRLTFEDKLAIKDFIKGQRNMLKAIETYLD